MNYVKSTGFSPVVAKKAQLQHQMITPRLNKLQTKRSTPTKAIQEIVQLAYTKEDIIGPASLAASLTIIGVFLGLVFLRIEAIYWGKKQEQWKREGRIK